MNLTWHYIMGLIASIALFLPITLIFTLKLARYRSFPALLIYYIIVVTNNVITQGSIKVNADWVQIIDISNKLLDAPLMLFFLTYFSTTQAFAKRMKLFILLFVVFEAVVIFTQGFNINAVVIIMAPSLLAVFIFSLYFFVRQTKITILHRKATGKALMASSLLFAYGCYGIIYLMFYIFKNPNKAETFVIYFLVTTFSCVLMSIGIIMERKRVQKLEELKVTRRELSIIYKDTRPVNPLKVAAIEKKERYN